MFAARKNFLLVALGLLLAGFSAFNVAADLQSWRADQAQAKAPEEIIVSTPEPGLILSHPEVTRSNTRKTENPDNPSASLTAAVPSAQATAVMPAEPATPLPPAPEMPLRLVIPAIALDAPILPAETQIVKVAGKEYQQWLAPDTFASGWHTTSAWLGEPGNTVLNGHHNMDGEVFARLVDLEPGDLIKVYGSERVFTYEIANKMILPEKYQELDVRMENAQWILRSDDERLTLITCWPRESNTHRLILVARPVSSEPIGRMEE